MAPSRDIATLFSAIEHLRYIIDGGHQPSDQKSVAKINTISMYELILFDVDVEKI